MSPTFWLVKRRCGPRRTLVLIASTRIQGDFDRSEFLILALEKWGIDNQPQAWIKSLSGIGTDEKVAKARKVAANEAAQDDLLSTAQQSIQASRSAIAKLIDTTPLDDLYTLGKLGPILAELRAAESILESLEPPNVA